MTRRARDDRGDRRALGRRVLSRRRRTAPCGRGASSEPAPRATRGRARSRQVEQDLDALLADTQRERDEYLDLAKRTKADFENYRKRMAAEVQAAAARGKAELVREVVPVLDDLSGRCRLPGSIRRGTREDGLAHGVLLVFRSLRETLARNGVEAVDPTGEKFDPTCTRRSRRSRPTGPSRGPSSR